MFALETAGNAPLALQALWFILIAVLWIGYLVLEGFDYGVAILIPILGRSEKEKRVIAYHEAGHALVGHVLPNTDPIHKVSIIARGRALGRARG